MLKTTWRERRMCQWTVGFLERRNPRRRESDCTRETASERKSVQRDHPACGGARCRSGQDTEGCAGAPHRDQSPAPRILCWLAEFAAYLMNSCDIGSDGKTPLQRPHGRKDNTPILEVGEKILYMPANPARRKVGAAVPPRSVCWHAELIVGGSGCHEQVLAVTRSERQENP